MPRTKYNALNFLKMRALTEPGVYSDGNGLTLRVDPFGAKRWVQRVTINGKQRNIGLGGYPAVSLAGARNAATANRMDIKAGRDVIAEKKAAQTAARQPAPSIPTFAEAAARVIELRRPTWSNPKHAAQWTSTLDTYANPVIGGKPVDSITTADVLTVLEPIWTGKSATASRVRQRLETVFDWAIAQGLRPDNPAGKQILRVLPKLPKTKRHHRAIPYVQVPGALEAVRKSSASAGTRLALEFLVLTAARSGEVRLARWAEIDWERATWTVPAERMKARRPHRVPLAPRALAVLSEAKELSGEGENLIFPASRSGGALSDMTLTVLLKRLEIPASPHGFRRSFKSWTMEQKVAPWFVGEAALAHRLGDETEQAYVDTDLFDLRREMMERWAQFVAPQSESADLEAPGEGQETIG